MCLRDGCVDDRAAIAAVSAVSSAALATLATRDVPCADKAARRIATVACTAGARATVAIAARTCPTETIAAGVAITDGRAGCVASLSVAPGNRLADGGIARRAASRDTSGAGAARGRSTLAAASALAIATNGVAALDHASGGIPAGRCKTAGAGTTGRGCAISSGGAGNSDEIRRDGGRRRKQVSVYTGRSGLILTLASGFGGGVATSDVATVRGTAGRSTSRAGAAIGIASLRGCAEAIPTGMPTAGRYRCRIIANDCGCVDRCSRAIADILGMHTWSEKSGRQQERENRGAQDRATVPHAFQRRTHPYGELDPSKVQAHFPVVGDRIPVYRSSYPNASGPGHASGTVVRRYERPNSTVRVMASRVSSPGWRSLPGWLPLVCFRLEHRRLERWRCWQSEERELP